MSIYSVLLIFFIFIIYSLFYLLFSKIELSFCTEIAFFSYSLIFNSLYESFFGKCILIDFPLEYSDTFSTGSMGFSSSLVPLLVTFFNSCLSLLFGMFSDFDDFIKHPLCLEKKFISGNEKFSQSCCFACNNYGFQGAIPY